MLSLQKLKLMNFVSTKTKNKYILSLQKLKIINLDSTKTGKNSEFIYIYAYKYL